MPVVPGLEDRIGNYRGWLALNNFPEGGGSVLRITGYELPFHYVHVRPSTPGDIRSHIVVDISSLDVPIELLEGETVEFGWRRPSAKAIRKVRHNSLD